MHIQPMFGLGAAQLAGQSGIKGERLGFFHADCYDTVLVVIVI